VTRDNQSEYNTIFPQADITDRNAFIHAFKPKAPESLIPKNIPVPETLAEKTAFLDSIFERNGAVSFPRSEAHRPPAKRFLHLLEHRHLDKGITDIQMQKIISAYITAAHGDPYKLLSWAKNTLYGMEGDGLFRGLAKGHVDTINRINEQKFSRELATKGLVRALREMDKIRDSKGVLEHASKLISRYPDTINNISFFMQSLTAVHGLLPNVIFMPLHSPSIAALNQKVLTPEILGILATKGPDAARFAVMEQFKDKRAAGELYFKLLTEAFTRVALAALVTSMAYATYKEIRYTLPERYNRNVEATIANVPANFWKMYKKEHGDNGISEEDRLEAERRIQKLQNEIRRQFLSVP
jgi:hypothetical protein